MTYPCPFCAATASAESGCPRCHRGPDADALAVIRADAEIAELTPQLATARRAVQELEGRLGQAWSRRHAAAARVRASVLAARPMVPAAPPMTMPAPRAKEASTKLVQNALFLLGGLLLGIAAIVFTAVAWAQFGVAGRAALLALFTGATLAVPPLALRRKLAATAETFAAVGLLLTLLDGYAAWHVNLFGLADGSPWGYAGAVFAVTAAVAAGYAHLTGLTGPRFAALLLAQPVLPLLIAPLHPGVTGWSVTFTGVAAVNLAVLAGARWTPLGWAATALGGAATALATVLALGGLAVAATPARAALAGAALLAAALLVLATSVLFGARPFREVATALLVVALGVAAGRWAALLTPGTALLRVAVVALAIALIAAVVRGPGARYGALIVVAAPALTALALTVDAATRTLGAARPFFHAALDAAVPSTGGTLPVVLAVLAAALIALAAARLRRDLALAAAAAIALALPASLHLPWWAAPILDLLVVAILLAVAVRHAAPSLAVPVATVAASPAVASPGAASGVASAAGQVLNAGPVVSAALSFAGQLALSALLSAHSLATGLGRPAVAAAVLGTLAALGLAVTLLARRAELRAAGFLTALLALPAIAWTTTAALTTAPAVQARAVLAATVLLAAAPWLRRPRTPGRRTATPPPPMFRLRTVAATAALATAALLPLWALLSGDPVALYAATSLLLIVAAGNTVAAFRAVALVPATALLAAIAPSLIDLLVTPYEHLTAVWAGGLVATPHVPIAHAAALLLTAVAAALVARRHALPVLALALPMTVAAADLPWPAVPAASLSIGLAALLATALTERPAPSAPVIGVLLTAAGLAGALPHRFSTLAALGALLITAAVAGTAGRTALARLIAWPAAVAAAVALAATAGAAADLDLLTTALLVLVAAAAALAVSWLPLAARPAESRAVEAAAHAGALVALLLASGSTGGAATVCTLWGLALGVRAMQPAGRHAYLLGAATAELAAWTLLMVTAEVGVLEAYTLPAALVALTAGLLARRRHPRLGSWAGYGPALAAALLPSLAAILVADGQHLRRLLLGAGALVVVVAGANARLRAPVLLGGGVLTLVGLHELALVWDLIPRWIPLAAGGLLLVLLAATLERRRRDLARFRAAMTRMS